MNTHNIKKYAPKARNQFRDAVIQKLTALGITVDKTGNLQIVKGEIIGGDVRYGQFNHPKSTLTRRNRLAKHAREQGFDVLAEHYAYTWFNRLCAIRYMELHDYLDHGFRVLSHPANPMGFEVLDHVAQVAESLRLDKSHLVEMKLAGNKDDALYRELLVGQCHALHRTMPFLFEAVDDEAELLLPDNLIRTDSILRNLVSDIPPQEWNQVEVIGWLYQFYISEKKDAVIGRVVNSEDIPAATQLFTPNWIVQYLVQNSVGRHWLQTYPNSPLKGKMDYYIEPAEQTADVQAQLAAITPASIAPESIKVLDPACGSGHILTEAYNVLKHIYQERGYRGRDIPQLILQNNLFGLDIDDRAAQLSGFALLMMARQDDRRIFTRNVRLNILSLQESPHLDTVTLWQQLNFHQQSQPGSIADMYAPDTGAAHSDSPHYQLLERTLTLFVHGKTLGSLIQVPHEEEAELKTLLDALYRLAQEGDTHQKAAAHTCIPYIHQAWILAQRYDAVVANPPYMGSKGMNSELKAFAKKQFPDSKSDLFAMFMQHAFCLLKAHGFNAQVNMQSWMFLSSYESLRKWLLDNKTFITMAHLGARAFSQISGEVVQTTAWVILNISNKNYRPSYFRLINGNAVTKKKSLLSKSHFFKEQYQNNLKNIKGSPIIYWLDSKFISMFKNNSSLVKAISFHRGISTGNNEKFSRQWQEVSFMKFCYNAKSREEALFSNGKWFPYNRGGGFKKWFGLSSDIIDYEKNGQNMRNDASIGLTPGFRHDGAGEYFAETITWTALTSGIPSFRLLNNGYILGHKGSSIKTTDNNRLALLGYLNSSLAQEILTSLSPTLDITISQLSSLPTPPANDSDIVRKNVDRLVKLAIEDYSWQEPYWFFKKPKLLTKDLNKKSLIVLLKEVDKKYTHTALEVKALEENINSFFIELFKVDANISAAVPLSKITLNSNLFYRYSNLTEVEQKKHNQSETLSELISYTIGCMMGRYSLDREGLVYAHEGNKGFAELVAEGAYNTFPADNDGILPLMDDAWFGNDITLRLKEFVRTVWGEERLQENLAFIAESLCLYAIKPKKGESSLDTLRRYLSAQFWKDHLKMYKRRPIYWLFSSGKEKAFECLVYLHRYHQTTLPRMRAEYVVPLLARYQANVDRLNEQIGIASGGEATRLKRERDSLSKKFNELRRFDDRLRHYADRRITLDLDDGVKVNYSKFGDLLADVKTITGRAPDII